MIITYSTYEEITHMLMRGRKFVDAGRTYSYCD